MNLNLYMSKVADSKNPKEINFFFSHMAMKTQPSLLTHTTYILLKEPKGFSALTLLAFGAR